MSRYTYTRKSRARALSIHTCIRGTCTEVQATSMRRDVYTYIRKSHACSWWRQIVRLCCVAVCCSVLQCVAVYTQIARVLSLYTYVYSCELEPRCKQHPWAGTWTYIHISRARTHTLSLSIHTFIRVDLNQGVGGVHEQGFDFGFGPVFHGNRVDGLYHFSCCT